MVLRCSKNRNSDSTTKLSSAPNISPSDSISSSR